MVAERCSVEPGNGDPRVSVDGVEISIDDGTDSRMVEVLELLESSIELFPGKFGENFDRELEPRQGKGVTFLVAGTINHAGSVLIDQSLDVIIALHCLGKRESWLLVADKPTSKVMGMGI